MAALDVAWASVPSSDGGYARSPYAGQRFCQVISPLQNRESSRAMGGSVVFPVGGGREGELGIVALGDAEGPVALEEDHQALVLVEHAGAVALVLEVLDGGALASHPAGVLVGQRLEDDLDAVLVLQPVLEHLELKLAHHAEHRDLLLPRG